MVEDGVNGNCGLSGLTVTNDQLTLTTTDRNHGFHLFWPVEIHGRPFECENELTPDLLGLV